MKNLLNFSLLLLAAFAVAACSGTKSAADGATSVPTTEPTSADLNTPAGPTGLTSAGVQFVADTTEAIFPVNEKGELTPESFVQLAELAGMKEIELGRIAVKKGQSDAVRSFAKMMVDDHTKAGSELQTLAGSKKIPLTSTADTIRPDQDYKAIGEQLSALDIEKFDQAYLITMLNDHRKAVTLFEIGARSTDPDIKAYAEKYLPTLRAHLTKVAELTK